MKTDEARRTLLVSAAAAFALATGVSASQAEETRETVRCYGINACRGMGDCGGKGHSCAGENECKGKGYLKLPKETCLKIQGGRLTEEPEAEKKG
jgi:uncharacterized membrane protein